MAPQDTDQISLNDLFAAFGVAEERKDAPADQEAAPPVQEAPKAPDTTEADLLHALGIPESTLSTEGTKANGSSEAREEELKELREEQRDRALQWEREMTQAKEEGAAAEEQSHTEDPASPEDVRTQPLPAQTHPLPTKRIGALQPLSSGSAPQGSTPAGGMGAPQGAQGFQSHPQQPYPPYAQPWPPRQPYQPQQPHPFPPGRMPHPAPTQQPYPSSQPQAQGQPLPWGQGAPTQPLPERLQQSQPVQGRWPSAAEMPSGRIASLEQGRKLPEQAVPGGISALEPVEVAVPENQSVPESQDLAADLLQPAAASSWESGIASQDMARPFVAPAQPAVAVVAETPVQAPDADASEGSAVPQEAPDASPAPAESEPPAPSEPLVVEAVILPENAGAPLAPSGGGLQPPMPFGYAPPPPVAYQHPAYPPPLVVPPAQTVASGALDKEERSSKTTHIIGAALIVMAVACAIVAVCLITGTFDLTGSKGSNHAPSQVAGQTTPGAPSGGEGSGGAADAGRTTEKVFSYVVRGMDGGTHETVETATFGQDGKLVSSVLRISVDSQEDADSLLEQLKQDYGSYFVDGTATAEQVECTVSSPRDDLDEATYTELLSTNVSEFKVVSE